MTILEPNKFARNGAQLKTIAMITMLIDHMAVVFIERPFPYVTDLQTFDWLTMLDVTGRLIGRLAFPIFAFFIAVGFFHTRDIGKYAGRLALFAVLSELPFDHAMFGRWNWGYQNIFFTLLIGLLMLHLVTQAKQKWLKAVYFLLAVAVAHFLRVDYGWFGVVAIGAMALLYRDPKRYSVPVAILFLYQYTAAAAIPLIRQYDGSRGKQNRWLMYAFYPLHLAILYLIGRAVWLL